MSKLLGLCDEKPQVAERRNRYPTSKNGLKSSRKLRSHSVQEVIANENVEIRVDTRIKTDVKIQHNRPDLFVYDKKRKEITLIEVGITNLALSTQRENEKTRKYNLIANELALTYKCKVKIIPYKLIGISYEIPQEAQRRDRYLTTY